jgi:hypothetical protein
MFSPLAQNYMCKVAYPHQKVSDIAINRTAHLCAFEIDVCLGDLLLSGVEGGLRLSRGAGKELLLLGCCGEVGQVLAAFCLYPFDLQIGSSLAQNRLAGVERRLKIEGIDDIEQVALVNVLVVDDVDFRDLP